MQEETLPSAGTDGALSLWERAGVRESTGTDFNL